MLHGGPPVEEVVSGRSVFWGVRGLRIHDDVGGRSDPVSGGDGSPFVGVGDNDVFPAQAVAPAGGEAAGREDVPPLVCVGGVGLVFADAPSLLG